jgi:hypothetical protein
VIFNIICQLLTQKNILGVIKLTFNVLSYGTNKKTSNHLKNKLQIYFFARV